MAEYDDPGYVPAGGIKGGSAEDRRNAIAWQMVRQIMQRQEPMPIDWMRGYNPDYGGQLQVDNASSLEPGPPGSGLTFGGLPITFGPVTSHAPPPSTNPFPPGFNPPGLPPNPPMTQDERDNEAGARGTSLGPTTPPGFNNVEAVPTPQARPGEAPQAPSPQAPQAPQGSPTHVGVIDQPTSGNPFANDPEMMNSPPSTNPYFDREFDPAITDPAMTTSPPSTSPPAPPGIQPFTVEQVNEAMNTAGQRGQSAIDAFRDFFSNPINSIFGPAKDVPPSISIPHEGLYSGLPIESAPPAEAPAPAPEGGFGSIGAPGASVGGGFGGGYDIGGGVTGGGVSAVDGGFGIGGVGGFGVGPSGDVTVDSGGGLGIAGSMGGDYGGNSAAVAAAIDAGMSGVDLGAPAGW